jgi:hypothetical protein
MAFDDVLSQLDALEATIHACRETRIRKIRQVSGELQQQIAIEFEALGHSTSCNYLNLAMYVRLIKSELIKGNIGVTNAATDELSKCPPPPRLRQTSKTRAVD